MGWPMDESDWLTLRFEENRTHLRAVAYQMLGSLSDAEDAVQETWLRLSRSEPSNIANLGGWLTTVTARVCLDMLRSRRLRREERLGVYVPDPIVSRKDGMDPEHDALLADSVGLALLVVLETLDPASEKWSMSSSRPRATATSTPSSLYSTRTSCFGPTGAPCLRAHRGWSAVRGPRPSMRSRSGDVPGSHDRRS
jgi:Sigma-70 region 2